MNTIEKNEYMALFGNKVFYAALLVCATLTGMYFSLKSEINTNNIIVNSKLDIINMRINNLDQKQGGSMRPIIYLKTVY